MKHTTIALLTLIVLANCTSAAPAPWGITINHDTKECAGFWGGDEYIAYGLPKGWTAYYPDPNTGIMTTNTGIMTTETGTCKFIKFTEGAEENCCKAMGYNYTGHEIGEFKPFKGFVACS